MPPVSGRMSATLVVPVPIVLPPAAAVPPSGCDVTLPTGALNERSGSLAPWPLLSPPPPNMAPPPHAASDSDSDTADARPRRMRRIINGREFNESATSARPYGRSTS